MKVLIQRVNSASVTVEGERIAAINQGLLLLVGLGQEDDESKLAPLAEKVANLRIFPDERGRFHFSVLDCKGAVLAVPQFTLFADTSKGRRPEFFKALAPELAEPLFEKFAAELRNSGISTVETGQFGAYMAVELVNDGPVTIMVES